ncbi:Flp family type IVb pilin [Chengkuizengella sediminis]|uniref:Flp family type IVb pilin n=1 Tax=Chengkuizengella sediminis TaxID=1885917 RepID=UPI00138A0C4B|nr:Flp family type IVb pilin [Chengkuizengella sediminis]NDI36371.1 Flp family type IVb pilin [Chengkuizengella sediminis]
MLKNKLVGLVKEEEGQGLTEYGLVLGIIAVAVVATIGLFRDEIVGMYETALADLQSR